MKIEQIAVQLYTLREHLKTLPDFAETCRKVSAIGYRAVQVSGVDYAQTPPKAIRQICADHGLTICATHENGKKILDYPETVVETLQVLGTRLTAYPFPADIDFTCEESVANFIAKLSNAGKVLAKAGMTLAYHNHQIEFRKLNGKMLLERIFAETSPDHLQGEPDTYWVQFGGGDPVAWCRKLSGRLPIIHLKDYRVNEKNEVEFCEVGRGNLDMPTIIAEAERAGCPWFAVEQDTCYGDPFESIRISFEYLTSLVTR